MASRYTTMQIATLIATLIAGGLISLFQAHNTIYIVLIVISSLLMFSLIVNHSIPQGRIQPKKNHLFNALPQNKLLGISLFIIVLILGLTNALIDPILPAILRANGLPVGQTSFWTTFFSLLTVMGSLIFQQVPLHNSAAKFFLSNELIVGLLMVLVSWTGHSQIGLLLFSFAIMSIGIAGFFIFKEIMEYDMFPKNESFIYLGIEQSGFLVGDALGAPLGTTLFQHGGTQILLLLFGILSFICGLSYYLLYKKMQTKIVNS
ncbi:MFS transporter [Bombilactobacillus folatiphilus]|uniref:MFS transporter n=1 Tax=Bombilactobacillus folatiphilus TaxID=2923362 RepID=A0ABY4P806_9LACO|nr:MFS transporter [Bombilactobacillus folatiphilus]UQS81792.1 MFS transporter [Bombilactobacillus folatiphilus]